MEFIKEHLELLLSFVFGPLITWFFVKRHYQKRDLASRDIELISENLKLYQGMIDDIEKRYEETLNKRNEQILELENQIDELKEQIVILKDEIQTLKEFLNKNR